MTVERGVSPDEKKTKRTETEGTSDGRWRLARRFPYPPHSPASTPADGENSYGKAFLLLSLSLHRRRTCVETSTDGTVALPTKRRRTPKACTGGAAKTKEEAVVPHVRTTSPILLSEPCAWRWWVPLDLLLPFEECRPLRFVLG